MMVRRLSIFATSEGRAPYRQQIGS